MSIVSLKETITNLIKAAGMIHRIPLRNTETCKTGCKPTNVSLRAHSRFSPRFQELQSDRRSRPAPTPFCPFATRSYHAGLPHIPRTIRAPKYRVDHTLTASGLLIFHIRHFRFTREELNCHPTKDVESIDPTHPYSRAGGCQEVKKGSKI